MRLHESVIQKNSLGQEKRTKPPTEPDEGEAYVQRQGTELSAVNTRANALPDLMFHDMAPSKSILNGFIFNVLRISLQVHSYSTRK